MPTLFKVVPLVPRIVVGSSRCSEEGVGCFVAVGRHEDDNVAAHTRCTVAFGLFLDGEEGLAAALYAVEAGVDDESIAQRFNSVEPSSECVERDALRQHLFGVATFENKVVGQVAGLGAESTYLAHVDAGGHEVGGELLVGDAVQGIRRFYIM